MIADEAPSANQVTAYDRGHLGVYIRLLDAVDSEAPWAEVTKLVLGIDPSAEPERAKRAYDSHLARARWMMAQGYRDLLRRG